MSCDRETSSAASQDFLLLLDFCIRVFYKVFIIIIKTVAHGEECKNITKKQKQTEETKPPSEHSNKLHLFSAASRGKYPMSSGSSRRFCRAPGSYFLNQKNCSYI